MLAISFVSAGVAVAGVLAVAVPVLIHYLSRLKRQRVAWAAMRFLRQAYLKQKRRLQMEHWTLLAARCLLVLILGLAIAGPRVAGGGVASLAGWLGAGASASAGRRIHLVLDNAITSGAGGRLASLRVLAEGVLSQAGPGDQVYVWPTVPEPGAGPASPAALSPPAARNAVAALEARAAAADWQGVWRGIAVLASDADAADAVVVLSDQAVGGGLDVSEAALLAGVPMQVLAPVSDAGDPRNAAVVEVEPERYRVLADASGLGGGLGVAVTVRRDAGRVGGPASVPLRLTLLSAADGRVAELPGAGVDAVAVFENGRPTTTLQAVLPLPPEALDGLLAGGATPQAERPLLVRASITGGDDLPADDASAALMTVRPGLRIGVSDVAAGPAADAAGLGPGGFLRLALTAGTQRVEVEAVAPADLRARFGSEPPLDGLWLLRPDRLSASAWDALAAWVQSGGALWVTPPSDPTAGNAWFTRLVQVLDLPWRPASAVLEAEPPAGLAVDASAPAVFDGLAAGWEALLRPVRVSRAWPLASVDDPAEALLRLGGSADAEPAVLMASRPVGEGVLIYLGTAASPAWSNLPAKPLFPALVQESMRAAVGGRPVGVTRVVGRQSPEAEPTPVGPRRPGVLPAFDGAADPAPVPLLPGWYAGPGGGVLQLPDVSASNVTVMPRETAARRYDATGADWSWFEASAVDAVLARTSPPSNLGRLLLWVALALLLLESVLARWFSHAGSGRPGLLERARAAWHRLRHGSARAGVGAGRVA